MKIFNQRNFNLIAFFGILAILVISVTACTKKDLRTEGSTQSQTSAAEQTQTAAENNELHIGSFISGHAYSDEINSYNFRTAEAGRIVLEIESDLAIYVEVYRNEEFIATNDDDLGNMKTSFEFTALPDTIYRLEARSYVRNTDGQFRITASQSQAAASFGGHNFSVAYIQHADMNHLANRRIIRHGAGYEKIIISADADIYEFKIYSLSMAHDDLSFFADDTVYSLTALRASMAIEYATQVSEGIPAEAISFKTADGAMYSYTLGVSGMDGTVILSPWNIRYPQTQQFNLSGQWRFESGSSINFFKQASVDFDTNGHIEIWVIKPGETYISGGKNILETGRWNITDGGDLAVYHESGVNGVFYFSFTLRNEVLSITDQNGNTAVYQQIYPQ